MGENLKSYLHPGSFAGKVNFSLRADYIPPPLRRLKFTFVFHIAWNQIWP